MTIGKAIFKNSFGSVQIGRITYKNIQKSGFLTTGKPINTFFQHVFYFRNEWRLCICMFCFHTSLSKIKINLARRNKLLQEQLGIHDIDPERTLQEHERKNTAGNHEYESSHYVVPLKHYKS